MNQIRYVQLRFININIFLKNDILEKTIRRQFRSLNLNPNSKENSKSKMFNKNIADDIKLNSNNLLKQHSYRISQSIKDINLNNYTFACTAFASEKQKYSNILLFKSILQSSYSKHFGPKENCVKQVKNNCIPYVQSINGKNQKVYLEVYGCQMNVNDSEIVSAILKQHNYQIVPTLEDANIVLLVTCAIRDGAEQKVWNKLQYFKSLKGKGHITKIGILGCMAKRLKHKFIEQEKMVDVIAGPDSYRDLPRLLSSSHNHRNSINIALSHDETYADITPIRQDNSKTAFVTIMRGCDNMCSYCIVPFTRGKERSRPIKSIMEEVRQLSDKGIKEITLLGQNVNSYRDLSEQQLFNKTLSTNLAKGFKTVYKSKQGGVRFCDLLDKVSLINREMRIRFTSPHPKDFPDEVLYLIKERSNICKQIHLPAQSGNTQVLTRMRRGYSREAYLDLVHHIRNIVPNVALSSDFIAGFCNETETEFSETLSLIDKVKYNTAYLFAYSMREKTTAHRRFIDDVDERIKIDRLKRMIQLYRLKVKELNQNEIGKKHLVLVERDSKRSPNNLQGRNDGNVKVIFPKIAIPRNTTSLSYEPIKSGDYIVVHISEATSQVLRGIPLCHSSIEQFSVDK